jgi:ABC-type glycerol-3-phosphate transport system permease component
MKSRELILLVVVHIILILGLVIVTLPLVWMVSTSLKSEERVFQWPPTFFEPPFVWSNYRDAVLAFPFLLYLRSTVVIVAANIIGRLISCSLVAYGFSRCNFKGRDVLFMLCLSTMMLPYQATMIPLYVMYQRIHWVNTLLPLIVPNFFGTPFFIFMLRQFFTSIPSELEDAAFIDGCSEFGTFWRIILPLMKPPLVAMSLFTFLWSWNDFLGPLIYLQKDAVKTLQLGLLAFQQEFTVAFELLMAASVLITLPCLIVFFLGQRIFIQGVVFTGVKA